MVRQNRISTAIIVTSILLLVGCAPAQYMPQFDDNTLRTKQREISNQTERVPHEISEDPNAVLSRIYNRLEPRAKEACIANGEKWLDSSCSNWRVQVLDDENFNAYATPNHEIVFTTEVFRYTKSDDELAFILAHEMGHHILNHAMEDAVNAEIMGATTGLLSGILMGAIASGLGASESTVNDVIEDAIEDGYESGRKSGRLTYSIDQESEADKLALQLVELSGYSQDEARDIMLFIGADSNNLRSKHNASHPSGAERLAAFDLYASLPSGNITKPNRSSSMVGCIYGNCENGQGTFTWADGDKYVGQWKDGMVNGQGTNTWADGDKYVGQWKDNKRNGQGTFTYADGRKQEGQWIDNEFTVAEEAAYALKATGSSVKDGVYVIPELGISVRDYNGPVPVALSLNFTGSRSTINKGGAVVVSVEQGGKASKLGIKTNYRIVSYTYKAIASSSFPFNNAQELKDLAKNKGSGYFTNFMVLKEEYGVPEWSKVCLLLC